MTPEASAGDVEDSVNALTARLEQLQRAVFQLVTSLPNRLLEQVSSYSMLPAALQEYTTAVRKANEILVPRPRYLSFVEEAIGRLEPITLSHLPLTADLLALKYAMDPLQQLLSGGALQGLELFPEGQLEEHRWVRILLFNAASTIDSIVAAEASSKLQSILQGAEEAAGKVSEINLSAEFKDVADKEENQANIFRGLAIAMFPIALAVAVYIVGKYSKAVWSNELIRLAIDIPILAAAFYFSAEAKDHRINARKARELQVRLATVRSYTEELPETERNQIRTALGLAVYREPASSLGAQSMSELTDGMLKRIAEIVKAARD